LLRDGVQHAGDVLRLYAVAAAVDRQLEGHEIPPHVFLREPVRVGAAQVLDLLTGQRRSDRPHVLREPLAIHGDDVPRSSRLLLVEPTLSESGGWSEATKVCGLVVRQVHDVDLVQRLPKIGGVGYVTRHRCVAFAVVVITSGIVLRKDDGPPSGDPLPATTT
jgi:hypothetical protein